MFDIHCNSADCVTVSVFTPIEYKRHIILCLCSKQIFHKVPDFNHLNLSIALLMGLIIFVSGIETATDNRVTDFEVFHCKYISLAFLLGWLSHHSHLASLFFHGCIQLDVV